MGRLKPKAEKNLDELFPDEKLTSSQLARFRASVKKAGGKQKYLVKVGAIVIKNGERRVVRVEGLNGQEAVKNTGLYHRSDFPIQFWEKAFEQLERLEYGLKKGEKQLDEFAKSIRS